MEIEAGSVLVVETCFQTQSNSKIAKYLAIWQFGHVRGTWPGGVPLKRALKMQLTGIDIRSFGHSFQKLRQKIHFCK